MARNDAASASPQVAESLHKLGPQVILSEQRIRGWSGLTDCEARQEARRKRRARRQAFLMLIASSVASVTILYGLWSLVARLV